MQVKDIAREDDGEKQEAVLTVVASPEEVSEATKEFFRQIGQREIPGFRKGKAPRQVLEQQVGGHANAMGGVAEVLINQNAFGAIDETGIIFLDEPSFNVDTMPEEGASFSFTVSGPVAPIMQLTSYEPVAIEMPPEEATDAEVEEQLAQLQDHYHTFQDIEDEGHAAEMGDYVRATMTITNKADGRLVSGIRDAKRMIGLGAGTMPESFDEKLIGAKVGDDLEFDFEAKSEDGTSDFGDGDLHAQVHIDGFRKLILPELDDEFASKMGCNDVDELKSQMRTTINLQKAQDMPKMKVDRAIEAVVGRLDGTVPEYFVDFVRQDVGREFMQSMQDQGVDLQQWMLQNAVNGDEMKAEIATEAERRAAIDCALEAVFAHNDWEITDDDIDALFEGEQDAKATRKSWEDAHRVADLHKMARRSKAAEWLADTAEVTVVE